jgi:long-chain fatty acid transport protein
MTRLPPARRAAAIAASLAASLAALLAAAPAAADTSNFRPYLVGGRAAGMGGAFTALADDGSGPWYNPAGIAFVEASQVSLTGSAYGLVSGTIRDALGDGRAFSYSTLDTFPTTTTAVWRLPDPGPDASQAVAVGLFIPDGFKADDRDHQALAEGAFFLTSDQQTLWFNATWARRSGALAFGVAAWGLMRTELDANDLTLRSAADPGTFVTITQRVDSTSYGGVLSAGIRWDATPALHLGLSAATPALGRGDRRVFLRLAAAGAGGPASAVLDVSGLHASPTEPARLQGGVAWRRGAFTAAADLTWRLPRTVVDDAGRAAEGLERRVEQRGTLDAAAGVEWVAADRFPLRAGVFTDRAASPGRAGVINTSHIDRYGLSASAGLRSEHTSTSLGLNLSSGRGRDVVPDNLDFTRVKTTVATQRLLYVFLATSYRF